MSKRKPPKRQTPAKTLPKTIYVKVADGETGPGWFQADENVYGLVDSVERGVKIKVGTYRLVETHNVEAVINAIPVISKKVSK